MEVMLRSSEDLRDLSAVGITPVGELFPLPSDDRDDRGDGAAELNGNSIVLEADFATSAAPSAAENDASSCTMFVSELSTTPSHSAPLSGGFRANERLHRTPHGPWHLPNAKCTVLWFAGVWFPRV